MTQDQHAIFARDTKDLLRRTDDLLITQREFEKEKLSPVEVIFDASQLDDTGDGMELFGQLSFSGAYGRLASSFQVSQVEVYCI